ncbi:Bug family tripartite tricarboxylate transporter substrate binding protein [Falsiroseomonas tokyonensis]|uniref:Bug family tripartite tricarboxylate transporter substrate binding protein n=1 Tax=Falsiroseomonas tokyonensis TaxID=430521 RepID=A0ABV7C2P6_9PROT|nr:tripartite tricarboxylate transporter substrate binding protein [Falsiroseomonas tokyonensis]MBU8540733.1 tripartite tricarboxylate transporter substrate binding protein [Falsiroseomonas tokyonensis]
MLTRRSLAGLLPLGLAAPTLATPGLATRALAQANDYPNRPIRLIVGFAAGGGTDLTARTMQPKLQEALGGANIVIENRPGAGGNLATEMAVRAAPDGYTLLMGTIGALAINPTIYSNLPFNPQTDLTPISMSGSILNVLVVPSDRPWRSVAELVAAAKARPETLTYGSSGVGGAGHLAGALLDQMAGIKTIHVPYRGGGPLMNDLAGAKIDFAFSTAPTAMPQVEGGRLRALAVPTLQRSELLPNVPTVAELLPGYEVGNWYALVGPRGLPPAVVEKLNAAMRQTLTDRTMIAHLARHGVDPLASTPEELGRFIRDETAKWAPIVRATGASAN